MNVNNSPLTLLRALAVGVLVISALLTVLLWPWIVSRVDAPPGALILVLWLGAAVALLGLVMAVEKASFYARSRLSKPVLFK